MPQAKGTYTIKKTTVPQTDLLAIRVLQGDAQKEWSGDIEGKSGVLTVETATQTPGSAGYIAVEEFHGTVHGRKGSFACLHRGIVKRDEETIDAVIVPDSGVAELQGIIGTLIITNDGDQLHYELDYEFMEPPAVTEEPAEEQS